MIIKNLVRISIIGASTLGMLQSLLINYKLLIRLTNYQDVLTAKV